MKLLENNFLRTLQKKGSRERNLYGTLLRKGNSPRLEVMLKPKWTTLQIHRQVSYSQ